MPDWMSTMPESAVRLPRRITWSVAAPRSTVKVPVLVKVFLKMPSEPSMNFSSPASSTVTSPVERALVPATARVPPVIAVPPV